MPFVPPLVGSRAEVKKVPALTAIPAGILSKAVDLFISIRALLSAIVCANGMAATYKYSVSGSPDVMTCSVVYRYP